MIFRQAKVAVVVTTTFLTACSDSSSVWVPSARLEGVQLLMATEVLAEWPTGGSDEFIGHASSFDRLGDGWVVADRASTELVVLAEDGGIERRIGRKGDGPGEFRLPGTVRVAPDGGIWIHDRGSSRLSKFQPDGEFVGSVNVPSLSFVPVSADEALFPLGVDGFAVGSANITTGELTPRDVGSEVLATPSEETPQSGIRWGLIAAGSGTDLVAVWDNLHGELTELRGSELVPASGRAVPPWFLEAATGRAEELVSRLVQPASGTFRMGLIKGFRVIGDDAIWLSAGWADLLGVELGESTRVVLAPREVEKNWIDILPLDRDRLAILYPTRIVIYRLAEAGPHGEALFQDLLEKWKS